MQLTIAVLLVAMSGTYVLYSLGASWFLKPLGGGCGGGCKSCRSANKKGEPVILVPLQDFDHR